MSVDPLSPKYPELTPYQFAANKPIWAIDLDGLEPFEVNTGNGKTFPSSIPDEDVLVVKANKNREGEVGVDEPFQRGIESRPSNQEVYQNLKEAEPRIVIASASFEWDPVEGSIGESEGFEAAVPVTGSGRNAINAFQNDRYITGTFYSIMTIGDLFLVKSLAQGGVRLTYAAAYKGGSWNGIRKLYSIGYSNKYTNVVSQWKNLGITNTPFNIAGLNGFKHHSIISRGLADNSPLLGRLIGNQAWNMKSFAVQGNKSTMFSHIWAAHPTGTVPAMKHFWTLRYQIFATPNWYKGAILSGSTRKFEGYFDAFRINYDF